ncbi:MAG: ankyrin repeat domain-containing protein [Gammaproteobacteria bacterium]
MLPTSTHNQFSAQIEKIQKLLLQRDVEHAQVLLPMDEQQYWLARRAEVLHIQLTTIASVLEQPSSSDFSNAYQYYNKQLNVLEVDCKKSFKELLNRVLFFYDEKEQQFIDLKIPLNNQAQMERLLARLSNEMELYRSFHLEGKHSLQQLKEDLTNEVAWIEQLLIELTESKDEFNLSYVDHQKAVEQQLVVIRHEREQTIQTIDKYENFLQACYQGNVRDIYQILASASNEERELLMNFVGTRKDTIGRNAFHLVCEYVQYPIVEGLLCTILKNKNIFDIPTDNGELPIHLAMRRDEGKRTHSLLGLLKLHGADIHALDKNHQRTPLNTAAYVGNITAITWLLEQGADLHAKDFQGRTALHAAAGRIPLNADIAKRQAITAAFLLDRGANPSALNQAEESPLFEAILKGQNQVVQEFSNRGLGLSQAEHELLQARPEFQSPDVQLTYTNYLQNTLTEVPLTLPAKPMPLPAPAQPMPPAKPSFASLIGWPLSKLFRSQPPVAPSSSSSPGAQASSEPQAGSSMGPKATNR